MSRTYTDAELSKARQDLAAAIDRLHERLHLPRGWEPLNPPPSNLDERGRRLAKALGA